MPRSETRSRGPAGSPRLMQSSPFHLLCANLAHNPAGGEWAKLALRKGWSTGLPTGRCRDRRVHSACGPLGLGSDGLDLVHDRHGVFARHAVGLEDRLDVAIDGLHLGRLDLGGIEHRGEVRQADGCSRCPAAVSRRTRRQAVSQVGSRCAKACWRLALRRLGPW